MHLCNLAFPISNESYYFRAVDEFCERYVCAPFEICERWASELKKGNFDTGSGREFNSVRRLIDSVRLDK